MKGTRRRPYTSDLSDDEWERIQPLIKADKHFGPKSRTKFSMKRDIECYFLRFTNGMSVERYAQ